MGDSSYTDPFSDSYDPLVYTGLSDTGTGFTGSSTMQTVELGSPLQLSTANGLNDSTSVVDLGLPTAPGSETGLGSSPYQSLQLSGVSDPPFASSGLSTPTPSAAQPAPSTVNALSGLSKFGSVFATLFGGTSAQVQAHPSASTLVAPGIVPGQPALNVSGSSTLILVVIAFALILLVVKGD